MSGPDEEFEALRREPDPVKRGRRATELLGLYQQRSTELARLRRAAIEEAKDQVGGSYTEVAKAFGLTKGRITQIRNSAPPRERAFFGVGPVTVALPGRDLGRRELVIASEDDRTADLFVSELERLSFLTERHTLDPYEAWTPPGDTVVICGPISAPIAAELLDADPVLGFEQDGDARWWIVDKVTGERHGSPSDAEPWPTADIGYVSRRREGASTIVHVAGIHTLGSVAAATHVTTALDELYRQGEEASFSLVVTGTFDEQTPTGVGVLVPLRRWDT